MSELEVEMEKVSPALPLPLAAGAGPGDNKNMNGIMKKEEEDKESPFENSTFNIFDALFVIISMGLLVADLLTDMIVTCKYFARGDTTWGALTLGFILVPSIILQVFSVRWYLLDDDMSALKWITHICQVGPLHRYVNLFVTGKEARKTRDPLDFERLFYQQSDVCMLRLFESFMESAPQVVLQLYIMVATNDENFWTGTSAAVSLFSLCWALGAYSRAHRKVRRDKKVVSWPGLVLQTMWRIGMVSSRVMALVLFASVFKVYIFLAVGIHWIGMMIWVHLQKTDFCPNRLEERLFNCVVAIIYVFCFFNLKEGKSRKRVLVFYSIMFVENTALLLVWYHYRTIGEWYNVAGFTIVFGGFGIGVVSMILYYRYLHPRNDFSLCGSKPAKEPSRSLDTTPSQSPASTHGNLFSPELYRHGHSPSPKQQQRSDVNHNNADSPLARPLSQTGISLDTDFVKENGIPHRSGKVKGEGHVMGRGDSSVRKSKRESCVYYNEDETVSAAVHLDKNTAGNASIMTNASLLTSFRCDISGFGTDLVQDFDDWRDHSHYVNHSVMSASSKSGNISRSLGSMLDQSSVLTVAATCVDSVDPPGTQKGGNIPFSPDLPQMPEIADSPNKLMTAYEAQQIYDSILGISHNPRRNSKRKLKFEDDSGKTTERTRPKSGNAVLHGKPTQKEVGNRSYNDTSGNRNEGLHRVVVTNNHIKDNVGNVCTSGQLLHAGNQMHHNLPDAATKDKDKCSKVSHKALTHQANNATVETKTNGINQDKRHETETTNFQDVTVDIPIDLNGATPLQGNNHNDLRLPINERREGFQNQNKPSILNVDVNSTCAEHVPQKGIASPMLRAALARDLFKAKGRVMSSQITNKADVHNEGNDKAMPVLGYMADDGKASTGDELPVAGPPPEDVTVKTDKPGLNPNVHIQNTSDLKGSTVLNGNNKPKQGHGNNAKQNITECKDNGILVSGRAESCVTEPGEGGNRGNSPRVQHKSPTKASNLFSSLSPKASIFSTSQARFNGSHSPLIGERASVSAGGSGHKFHGRSPAGKTNLKRVRSLKGSAPSENPSRSQECSPRSDGFMGKGHSDKGHDTDQVRTPIANLKGKIKRALSIKAKVPYDNTDVDSSPSVENHLACEPGTSEKREENVVTLSGSKADVDQAIEENIRERPVLVETQSKKALSHGRYDGNPHNNRIHSPKKTGSEPLSLPTSTLSSPVGKENRGFTPVLVNRNTSPQNARKENARMFSGSPQKTGKDHISLTKGNTVCTPGKENRGFAPGSVKGTVSRHANDRLASLTGKKPPRRSLNRIPTNLVADNVARFDSPSK